MMIIFGTERHVKIKSAVPFDDSSPNSKVRLRKICCSLLLPDRFNAERRFGNEAFDSPSRQCVSDGDAVFVRWVENSLPCIAVEGHAHGRFIALTSQLYPVIWRKPSEDPDRSVLDIGPVAGNDALARAAAEFGAGQGLLQERQSLHQGDDAECALVGRIDEYVDV